MVGEGYAGFETECCRKEFNHKVFVIKLGRRIPESGGSPGGFHLCCTTFIFSPCQSRFSWFMDLVVLGPKEGVQNLWESWVKKIRKKFWSSWVKFLIKQILIISPWCT